MVTGELKQTAMTKWLTKEFNKRVVVDDYRTVPFGYKGSERYSKSPPIHQLELDGDDDDDDDIFTDINNKKSD